MTELPRQTYKPRHKATSGSMRTIGSSCSITHDIIVEGQVAFKKGETVVVEGISPNPQRPRNKYIVLSQSMNRHFLLPDADLLAKSTLPQSVTHGIEYKPVERSFISRFANRKLVFAASAVLLVALAAVLILVVALTGNKTTSEAPATTPSTLSVPKRPRMQPLQVRTVGFSKWQYVNSYNVGGILFNPNGEYAAVQTVVTVSAYDENDVVLGSRTEYVQIIPPQQEMGFTSNIGGDAGQPVRVEVTTRVSDWQKMPSAPLFTFENTALLVDRITGIVVNKTQKDMKNVKVITILRDPSGNALGGGVLFVGEIQAQQKVAFEARPVTAMIPTTISFYGDISSLNQVSP